MFGFGFNLSYFQIQTTHNLTPYKIQEKPTHKFYHNLNLYFLYMVLLVENLRGMASTWVENV
jgi:hypothetical protein